jgi:hypothetical protein
MPTIPGSWNQEPSQDEMATIKAEIKAKDLLNPSYQRGNVMRPNADFGGEGWVRNPNAKAPGSLTMDYQPEYIRDPNFGKVREFNSQEQLMSAGKVGGPSADQLAAMSNTAMRSSIALRRGGSVGGLTRAIKGY